MRIINGNNIEVLKEFSDNHFDAVVTDPPYGLGKEPDAEEVLKSWIESGYHEVKGAGFMGKEWDAFVPQPLFWKEVFRVLKHGGHVLSFFGTRTYDWGVMAMRLAGFEVRDSVQWIYGCLSDDTEILTRGGYIQYHKFKKLHNFEQIEILIYDSENDIYKWEKPERWNEYNIHQDTCYRIKSDSTDQIVSRNHRCLVERKGKLVLIQAEQLSEMEYMPTLSDDFFVLQESEVLQSSMQWRLSGSGMEATRTQRKEILVRGNKREISSVANGREQSCLEGGNNISEKERVLFGSEVEICEMPKTFYINGEKGWLCGGVQINNGKAVRESIVENGVRSSHRPQSNEQRYKQFDVVCNEQRTQAVRIERSYSTTLATITPVEYTGVIFCPTVSTGCFVARRNGKVFITGNSGFPKSHNISKAIDKMGGEEPTTEEAKKWDGWGSALKPANEPIVLARKPLEKGLSIAENVLKWGTGAINIDGCRVSFKNEADYLESTQKNQHEDFGTKPMTNNNTYGDWSMIQPKNYTPEGRFPANVILSHHPACEMKGYKKVKGSRNNDLSNDKSCETKFSQIKTNKITKFYGSEEEIEHWECHEDCPIKIMDEQSGISKSTGGSGEKSMGALGKNGIYGSYALNVNAANSGGLGDSGGASRFFYQAKASKSERNRGLNGFEEKQTKGGGGGIGDYLDDVNSASGKYRSEKAPNKNFHPTVKPVKLMQYLVKMITPPNGIVLDPFVGSGTTGIACKLEGFDFVGIEQDAEYSKIAESRINNWNGEYDEVPDVEIKQEENHQNIQQLGLF